MATVEEKQLAKAEVCLVGLDYLNDRESDFVRDVHGRLASGESLSDAQTDWLDRIYEKVLED